MLLSNNSNKSLIIEIPCNRLESLGSEEFSDVRMVVFTGEESLSDGVIELLRDYQRQISSGELNPPLLVVIPPKSEIMLVHHEASALDPSNSFDQQG